MLESSPQNVVDALEVSRRDFLKFCSLMVGSLAVPRPFTNMFEQVLAAPDFAVPPKFHFQWQNEFLLKTIYPLREVKLRDFLIYYMEVDVWAQIKNKQINALPNEVNAYKKAWELNAAAAFQEYGALRDYFLQGDVRGEYSTFQPIDEAELSEINNLHAIFQDGWPRDIRGERSFVESMLANWVFHRNLLRDWITSRSRRHAAMDPSHVKYEAEGRELTARETITLPMAEREMEKLRAFLATYDRIEERKLAWYRLSKSDPNFKIPEAQFLVMFPAAQEVTIRDIAHFKVEEYKKGISRKNQYELLDMINQRFQKEPKRFPAWLQYMVVHFSGMRYASAHWSWADPKDLLIRLGVQQVQQELQPLDDAEIEKHCAEKITLYESTGGTNKPKLALAAEKEWKDKVQLHLNSLKASGPKTRRAGLLALQTDEVHYEIKSLSTEDALLKLKEMKSIFPTWAWKEIIRLTPLRVTEVTDMNWEKLTPQEEETRYAPESHDMHLVMDTWKNHNPSAWREEHGRTLELIVTRAVCNEVAEHCQHIRGHLPPGGLAAKPKWYLGNEADNQLPGSYFVKPVSEKDYTQGASILWLRFVNFSSINPSEWQIARWVETKEKVGLLPVEFKKRNAKSGNWVYKISDITTRSRTTIAPDKRKVVENQWLRWIHEATVAEVAETADGMMVISFETARPDGDQATASVGVFKMPLSWHLSDGTEEEYNRSFVGFVPEGQVSAGQLRSMLDWNKIFKK